MSVKEFDEQIMQHAEGLMPFAITLTRDRDTARDLCQETLYKALAHRDKYESGTNIRAWLSTIMRNIFINEYRRGERKRVITDAIAYAEKSNTSFVSAEKNVRLKEINKAICDLPSIFKTACILYLHGYKYSEIAHVMNEPLGTIKSRIHFARKQLQKRIDR